MEMTRSRHLSAAGFTLVELLIVIVVLGILAGIALIAGGTFREDATQACESANERTDQSLDAVEGIRNGDRPEIVAGGDC